MAEEGQPEPEEPTLVLKGKLEGDTVVGTWEVKENKGLDSMKYIGLEGVPCGSFKLTKVNN